LRRDEAQCTIVRQVAGDLSATNGEGGATVQQAAGSHAQQRERGNGARRFVTRTSTVQSDGVQHSGARFGAGAVCLRL
jgi:hypothetical protein